MEDEHDASASPNSLLSELRSAYEAVSNTCIHRQTYHQARSTADDGPITVLAVAAAMPGHHTKS